MMHVMSHQSQQPTQVCVCVSAQMVDMEVVVVLVMAMECDGAFMVTITTLVSCHSHTHTVKRGWKEGQWWIHTTSQRHQVVVGWSGWCASKVDEPHNTKHHTAKPVSFLPLTNPMPSNTHPCAISPLTGLIKCHHHSFNHQEEEGRKE